MSKIRSVQTQEKSMYISWCSFPPEIKSYVSLQVLVIKDQKTLSRPFNILFVNDSDTDWFLCSLVTAQKQMWKGLTGSINDFR